jgi:hypothetical protein
MVLLNVWYVLASIYQVQMAFTPALLENIYITVPLTWVVSYFFIDPIDRFFVASADKSIERRHFQQTN